MKTQVLSWLVVVALVMSPMPTWAQATAGRSDLAAGIRQVEEGDFEVAAGTLDKAIKAMAGDRTRSKELAKAYLYLAVANLGMSREANARARMLEAIKSDESLSLSTAEFPPNVIQLFEEVRQEAGYTPASRATDDSRSTTTVVPSKKKGGSKLPIILIGAAAVGGGALLLMPKNAAPVAGSATATPGTALMAATEVSFASVGASDKDGDTLTYTWDFGDDTAGSGLNVKHVYAVAGNYAAKVTVSDGKKSASTTAPPVTVKNVNGTWRTKIVDSVITFILSQNGANASGSVDYIYGNSDYTSVGETISSAQVRPPMHLTIKVNVPTYYRGSNYGTNIYTFDCDFNSTIDTCSGTAVSGSSSWSIVIQK